MCWDSRLWNGRELLFKSFSIIKEDNISEKIGDAYLLYSNIAEALWHQIKKKKITFKHRENRGLENINHYLDFLFVVQYAKIPLFAYLQISHICLIFLNLYLFIFLWHIYKIFERK